VKGPVEIKWKGKETRRSLGNEEVVVTPISSQSVDILEKDKPIMMDQPTASKKTRTSQYQKPSPSWIPKTKRQQRKNFGQGECSDSSLEETIELSPEPVNKLQRAHELNIWSRK
jgi:hypothetical protein